MELMSAVDAEQHFPEYARFTEWIKATGHFIGANRLKPAATATPVRARSGRVLVRDGPFAETKEQLGDYGLSEAHVLNFVPCSSYHCSDYKPTIERQSML